MSAACRPAIGVCTGNPQFSLLLGFLEHDPGNHALLVDAAEAAIDAHQPDAAIDLLDRAAVAAAPGPRERNLAGLAAMHAERFADAATSFAQLLDGQGGCRALTMTEMCGWTPSDGSAWFHLERNHPAAAEWVAGPVGSGLYGSAFSPAHCRRIVLAPASFFTANDLLLSRGDGPIYLLDDRGPADRKQAIRQDWQIDAANVERCLATIFKEAPRQ